MDTFRFSTTRCRSETFITLPGGVSFLISIHNDLSQAQRKSLLRRIFRQLKPVMREIGAFYTQPKFDPRLDPRSVRREGTLTQVGKSHELEAIRTRLGWTQQDLAHRTGVTASQLSRIEQGHSKGRPSTWKRIFTALEAELKSGGAAHAQILRKN